MRNIPDITDTEMWIVRTTLRERYGTDQEVHLADSEIRLEPSDRETTSVPTLLWEDNSCHLVIFKSGEKNYRCLFYYRGFQQYGTGIREYDDLAECVVGLLQAQADHTAQEAGDITRRRR
jgi:hypothetical protein